MRWADYAVALLVLVNSGLFVMKGVIVLTTLHQRSPERADEVVAKFIPPKAKVVGDYHYYYSVVRHDVQFRALPWYDPVVQTNFVPDFVLLNSKTTALVVGGSGTT
jgi:hypothetical protein